MVYNGSTQRKPLIQKQPWRLLNGHMYYVGLDIHKKTISYCVK
jgi:hypothetical protein